MVKKVMNPDSSKASGPDFIPVVVQRQCHTQSFFGHTSSCTGTRTLTKILKSDLSERQNDKS